MTLEQAFLLVAKRQLFKDTFDGLLKQAELEMKYHRFTPAQKFETIEHPRIDPKILNDNWVGK